MDNELIEAPTTPRYLGGRKLRGGRVRGTGRGTLELRNRTWYFRWTDYDGKKSIHRGQVIGRIDEFPTRESAEAVADVFRMKIVAGRHALRTAPLKRTLEAKARCSDEQYTALVIAQQGRCAICHTPEYRLVIDHCHETGKLRELLCGKCNSGIGMLGERIAILESAIEYLNKHREGGCQAKPTQVSEDIVVSG